VEQEYKWDLRFLGLAKHISEWSLDPSTKVGSVIVDNKNRIISLGYNGFPRGISDDERLNDREQKYKIIVHAERNAIIFAGKPLDGATIYTYPFMPCSVCAGMIIQAGITRVVTFESDNPRWKDDFALSSNILLEAGIKLRYYSP
jgi:dCMP deaminase